MTAISRLFFIVFFSFVCAALVFQHFTAFTVFKSCPLYQNLNAVLDYRYNSYVTALASPTLLCLTFMHILLAHVTLYLGSSIF